MAFTLDAMSIYGQDTRMLESLYRQQDSVMRPPLVTHESPQGKPKHKQPTRCPLLDIPLELRRQIYEYILPGTIQHATKGVVGLRGSTSIMSTNSQIHEETSTIVYGSNIFAIDVVYDCSTFVYQWLLPGGLIPKRRFAFPEQFGTRYVKLLRRFQVFVHSVDQYTGMIKYNSSESGLTEGLREQVAFLCQHLGEIPEIIHLGIHFKDDTRNTDAAERVLKPFLKLKNVRQGSVAGNVSVVFADALSAHLNERNQSKATTLTDLPLEIRRQIYDYMMMDIQLRSRISNKISKCDSTSMRHEKVVMSLACANRKLYTEISTSVAQKLTFRLSVHQNLSYRFELVQQSSTVGHRVSARSVSLFPEGLNQLILLNLTGVIITIAYIPLTMDSPQFRVLEEFFDKLVEHLRNAPLKNLILEVAESLKKTSSGDSHGSPDQVDRVGTLGRSLNHNTMSPQGTRSGMPSGNWHPSNSTPAIVSSPTTSATPNQSTTILQTQPMMYLIAKFNPIMAQVKARRNGAFQVHRYATQESAMDEGALDLLAERQADTAGRSPIDRLGSAPVVLLNAASRSFNRGSPRSTTPSSTRSSSTRRSARGTGLLFGDVPI